jgi:light-regulated signal transduction histidine kinase (bacteriophytochrome)
MQTLIQDLLAFARVGRNGKSEKASDCNRIVQEALLNLRAAIDESGAVVSYDSLPEVAAERSQMLQLFQNLIGNALKFHGPDSPSVRISFERMGAQAIRSHRQWHRYCPGIQERHLRHFSAAAYSGGICRKRCGTGYLQENHRVLRR